VFLNQDMNHMEALSLKQNDNAPF